MSEQTTETERMYNDMTGKQAEELPEQVEENETEEMTNQDEAQTAIDKELAEYQSKIDELDAKLAEHKAQYIDALKREQMRKNHYSDDQIERYLSFIEGETAEEIAESVSQLAIPPKSDNYADPSPMNGERSKAKTTDFTELGRQAFHRVKNRIFMR